MMGGQGGKPSEATDLAGDLNYGVFTMTTKSFDPKVPPENVVCVKQEGRVSEQAVMKVQVVSPGQIEPSCKLLQKGEVKDDIVSILNASAQKGATHVSYGEQSGDTARHPVSLTSPTGFPLRERRPTTPKIVGGHFGDPSL